MKYLNYFLLALLIFMFISCEKEQSIDVTNKNKNTELRQDRIPGFSYTTGCAAENITFFIDPNCKDTDYSKAIADAVKKYNAAPIGVTLIQVSSAENADFEFSCVDGDICGEGAWLPNGGLMTTGSLIQLEVSWEECECGKPSLCILTRTVMHEIGHALGIHHNGEGINIPGTPNTFDDPNSIFNSGPITDGNGDWCDAPCEFNANDIKALQTLYPVLTNTGLVYTDTDDCCRNYTITFDNNSNTTMTVFDDNGNALFQIGPRASRQHFYTLCSGQFPKEFSIGESQRNICSTVVLVAPICQPDVDCSPSLPKYECIKAGGVYQNGTCYCK